jgi:predicted NAD/FAD-dependent oxidoreductase
VEAVTTSTMIGAVFMPEEIAFLRVQRVAKSKGCALVEVWPGFTLECPFTGAHLTVASGSQVLRALTERAAEILTRRVSEGDVIAVHLFTYTKPKKGGRRHQKGKVLGWDRVELGLTQGSSFDEIVGVRST